MRYRVALPITQVCFPSSANLLTHYKCVTYVCDKRFLLVLKFADYAVEPFYYERGVDFYENGQNYAMASLLSVAGPTLLGQTAFDALLASFQHAVKEKTLGGVIKDNQQTASQLNRRQKRSRCAGPLQSPVLRASQRDGAGPSEDTLNSDVARPEPPIRRSRSVQLPFDHSNCTINNETIQNELRCKRALRAESWPKSASGPSATI